MTAEIAVFNSTAIALAADSAATTGSKIYNSAEKLFELTKHHPVGVMIYNNSSICGAPWELVIKSYRRQLEDKSFSTLAEYSDDFFEYLSKNESIVTPEMKKRRIEEIFATELGAIVDETNNIDIVNFMQTRKEEPTFDVFYSILSRKLEARIEELNNNKFLVGFDEDDIDTVRSDLSESIMYITNIIVAKEPEADIPHKLSELIKDYLSRLICKNSNCNIYSGIVFAGYGDDEYYPSLINVNILGIYKNKVLIHLDMEKLVTNGKHCAIIPFAQDEEVISFIEGCNNSIRDFTIALTNEIITRAKNHIEDNVIQYISPTDREGVLASLTQLWPQLLTDFLHKRNTFVRENQVDKVISMLSSLSKNDLAYMAESLVNLTAFKRKVSNEHDTVGGPIDVAVISKGDGFIWVKRKHYFKPELNQNFLNRNKG
ncbi:TPA: hypothetical protein ACIAIE_001451 [Serratia fonticola]